MRGERKNPSEDARGAAVRNVTSGIPCVERAGFIELLLEFQLVPFHNGWGARLGLGSTVTLWRGWRSLSSNQGPATRWLCRRSVPPIRVDMETRCGHESVAVDVNYSNMEISQALVKTQEWSCNLLGGPTPRSCDRLVPTANDEL